MSPSSPPSLSPVLLCAASYLPCCMSRPSTSCHHASRYLPPSASSSWRGQTTGIVWFCEKARPLPDCWVFGQRTCACDAAPARFFLMLSFFAPGAWVADDLENNLIVQSLVVIKQPPFENTGKHVIVKCLFLELLNSYFSFSTLWAVLFTLSLTNAWPCGTVSLRQHALTSSSNTNMFLFFFIVYKDLSWRKAEQRFIWACACKLSFLKQSYLFCIQEEDCVWIPGHWSIDWLNGYEYASGPVWLEGTFSASCF